MEIVNVRIDSRLIHGQVAAMWTGVLKATRIMVIDNMVVKNEMMKRMLKMACPGGLKLSILNTETASENIKSKYPEDRIFVIVKQPETLLELVQFGFPLEEVTVGNINSTRGSRQIRKTICVTPQDEEVFHTLAAKGIKLTAQMVPTEEKNRSDEIVIEEKKRMLITSDKVWIDETFIPATLEVEQGRIKSIILGKAAGALDYGNLSIIPGLIDIHTHGYQGSGAADANPEFLRKWAAYYPREGVTTFLPGINVTTEEMIKKSLEVVADVMEEKNCGAEIYGSFLQAPFMDHNYCGTYNKFLLQAPTVEHVKEYIECSRNTIRTISLAPENDKDHEVLKYCIAQGIQVCLGFSNCSYEEAMQAITEGARNVIHCFNCMGPLLSREPHLPMAGLLNDEVFCEVMADGVHVHPSVMSLVGRMKGKDKLITVTDSTSLKGLKAGIYSAEGGATRICEDGVARLMNGKIAGSLKPMIENIKNMQQLGGLPLVTAINAATINPAKLLRIDDQKGLIREGYIADLTIYDETYQVIQTYVHGKPMI